MILGWEFFGFFEKGVIGGTAAKVRSETALKKLTFAVWTLLFWDFGGEGPFYLFIELFFVKRVVDLYS